MSTPMQPNSSDYEGVTIASDEGCDWAYVLIDERVPDYATARVALRERALSDWGMKLGTVENAEPHRRWYRWTDENGEDELTPCNADDPRRDSEWFIFDLSMQDHEMVLR